MHERELKVLWRGGTLLAIASVVRLVAAGPMSGTPLGSASVLDSLLVASRAVQESDARSAKRLAPGEKIDPNTADPVELARLPGVGPALAARIVSERSQGGHFTSANDLVRVNGIGPSLVERLSESVTLPTGAGPRPPPRSEVAPETPSAEVSIDLNRADVEALVALPGVGPVLAQRIVAFRLANGPFSSPRDLLQVRGIGEAKLRDIEAVLAGKR